MGIPGGEGELTVEAGCGEGHEKQAMTTALQCPEHTVGTQVVWGGRGCVAIRPVLHISAPGPLLDDRDSVEESVFSKHFVYRAVPQSYIGTP